MREKEGREPFGAGGEESSQFANGTLCSAGKVPGASVGLINLTEKKEERKSGKSGSGSTQYNSGGSTDHEQRGSGSEFNSQNTSDVSGDSSGRSMFPSFSQRPCSNLRVLSFSELKAATKNFNRSLMVGEGGFGCVYKGSLRSLDDPSSRLEVAVKQLNRKGLQGHKEWITEVNVLGVVEHPNLVKLIGYCADDDERGIQRLLVYEFMPNGSVEYHLSPRTPMPLPWSKRLTIALDAARGLTYLHEGMDFQIIFRDLKTSNILLDEQWNAKLSDFGLARQGPGEGLSHVSTAVVGTIGYAAPEYLQTGRLTAKSDIWSFGVVLYELITGRRPVDRNRPKSEQKVLEWVRPYISDSKKFHMIIDPRINGQYKLKTVQKLAAVANRCLVRQPKARPKMSEVLEMIKHIVETSEAMNPDSDMGNSSMNSHASQSSCEMASSDNALDAKIMENGRSPLRMWMPKLIWSC